MDQSPLSRVRTELTAALSASGQTAPLPERASLAALTDAARAAKLSDAAINRAVATALGVPYADTLSSYPTSSDFVATIPIAFARQHGVLGLAGDDGHLLVALADPARWEQLQVISRTLGKPVAPLLAPPNVIAAAINEAYQQRTGQARDFIEKLDRSE